MAIKINLLPREGAAARPAAAAFRMPTVSLGGGLATKAATGLFLVVILGLGLLGYLAWTERRQFEKDVVNLRAENDKLQVQLVELRMVEEARLDIERRLDVIGRVAKSQGVPVNIMNGVLRSVPQGIWLTSMEVKPQEARVKVEAGRSVRGQSDITRTLELLEQRRQQVQQPPGAPAPPTAAPKPAETKEVMQLQGFAVVVKGLAFNNFQLADFMDNLRKSGVFADVDFVVTQADRIDQTRLMAFEVTASVKL